MSRFRETLASLPGTQAVWRVMKSLPGQLVGLPPIDLLHHHRETSYAPARAGTTPLSWTSAATTAPPPCGS